MNEQINSVPEQETEQKNEVLEQQTAADQTDYKAELEKANARIAELELECDVNSVKEDWLIANGSEKEVIAKAREMISHGFAENITQAVGLLKATMPDLIKPNEMPKFSFSTNGGTFGKKETSFSKGFNSEKLSDAAGSRKEW